MKPLNSFIWLMRIFNQMINITHTSPLELTQSFYSSIIFTTIIIKTLFFRVVLHSPQS